MSRKDDAQYQQWLVDADLEDTKENYEWYKCKDEDRSKYIKEHRKWWDEGY